MKRIAFLVFLFVLAGCATAQKYQYEITGYEMPLPSYALKLAVYYQPKVEGGQLLEMEYNQFGTEKTGYFRVAFGSIMLKKFSSAFTKMFEKVERSLVSDRPTRLFEAKSKHIDLLCEIRLLDNSFKWEKQEGVIEGYVKGMLNPFPRKTEYSAKTDFGIWISFYKPDGAIITENSYPYAAAEPVYLSSGKWASVLLETSNKQFSKGIDEAISRAVTDLKNSEKFKELVDSRKLSKEETLQVR